MFWFSERQMEVIDSIPIFIAILWSIWVAHNNVFFKGSLVSNMQIMSSIILNSVQHSKFIYQVSWGVIDGEGEEFSPGLLIVYLVNKTITSPSNYSDGWILEIWNPISKTRSNCFGLFLGSWRPGGLYKDGWFCHSNSALHMAARACLRALKMGTAIRVY